MNDIKIGDIYEVDDEKWKMTGFGMYEGNTDLYFNFDIISGKRKGVVISHYNREEFLKYIFLKDLESGKYKTGPTILLGDY